MKIYTTIPPALSPARQLLLWAAIALLLTASTPSSTFAATKQGRLLSPVTLATSEKHTGVRLALDDLARDCRQVLGGEAHVSNEPQSDIAVRIDPALPGPEAWRIEITENKVLITGSDELGAIYGIYKFSEKFLGVDPYWFWKDRAPAPQASIALPPQSLRSTPHTFRLRGWFVNDEDLLTEWKDGGGRRFIDYAFYAQVIHPEIADRIFETILRAGGNLIIPASFVDVMNPPEAALVRHAAERGLFISQHHIEPLGVSFFGFQNFWKARGEQLSMAYSTQPDKARETWRAYAAKWRELAGDRIVWQIGLRGRADAPVWTADKGARREDAGGLISRAMADQMKIIREVDPRPKPPVTTTLWAEGSELMRQGTLAIPEGVTIVFSDDGKSQSMQDDFYNTPRRPGRGHGVYYHIGFWINGPHLVQGMSPERIKKFFGEIVAKGDTDFAIINVCNIREHVLGVQAATENMTAHAGWDPARFMERFAPPALIPAYRAFFDSFVKLDEKTILQDGFLYQRTAALRKAIAGKRPAGSEEISRDLQASIAKLDRVIADYPAEKLTPGQREFFDVNLLTQAKILRGLYIYYNELILATHDRDRLSSAAAALAEVLAARKRAEEGKWANWYRGDKKMNLPRWLEETKKLAK